MDSIRLAMDPNRALPASAYRDQAWLRAEKETIWHGDWVFVATEDALPVPGDQLPVVVGDQPVLLLRNQAGELTALSNLCAHRGTLLVESPTNSKRIQCPYHAWTYDDTGRLLAVPFAPTDTIDKASHCLPAYRVASWHGLVFASLNPDVEPLADRFAAIEPLLVRRGINELRHQAVLQTTDVWACNWKVAILNAMESYHLFKVHATTLEPVSPTKGAYYITGSARATATGGSTKGHDDYLLVSLPPGFVGVLTRGSFVWLAVHPIDTDRCTVRTGGAFASHRRGGGLDRLRDWIGRTMGEVAYAVPDFLPEDKAICERVQRGIGGDFAPGQLVPMERVVADFGHYLNWRLNEVEPPAVHTEPMP
ncbi:MAG: aromatic ring-hydroxylating dioxygenase subunit alpha [Gammaproteobacteria bacterium]|nr:aromatic ring-hydroxylating dioxygenase subunit alpha [Gammaproteobacteria bacterium]MDE0443833.1 aromatic ring-hydroxylating dioxygenase subunit alpha [Gammaproteobacteria bacterium]